MYIRRWLEAPVQTAEGLTQKQGTGTPQGGVISPLLANLFLHYVLDKWIEQTFPTVKFVRYADDIVVHCKSENQSHYVLEGIRRRLKVCHLQLNEEKTKIIYCKDYRREEGQGYGKSFDFLGQYFGKMETRKLEKVFRHLDCRLAKWVKNKFKNLRSYQKAYDWLRAIKLSNPNMFAHWSINKI